MPASKKPWFEIRTSPIAGKGAFALRTIPAFTRLIEYTGERVSHKVADTRYADEEARGNYHTVLFAVDDDIVIDANVDGNDARFFNHSCGPNCQSIIVRKRVWLETIRRVKPGEELVYDYEIPNEGETPETALEKYPCHCGAPECRKTLLMPPVKKKKTKKRTTAPRKKSTRRRSSAATGKKAKR